MSPSSHSGWFALALCLLLIGACGPSRQPDLDGDGARADIDCNDLDPDVRPGANEDCSDGIDNDCDGNADASDSDCGSDDDDASDDDDSGDDDDVTDDDDSSVSGDDDDDDDDTTNAPYEGDQPGECDDGADNDLDALYDCDDPDCAGAPACAETLNTAPSAPQVEVIPGSPHSTHPLNCLIVTPSVDTDGDLVTYAWSWTVDGSGAGINDALIPASETSTGEEWTCSVTPSDEFDAGPPGSATVTISNEPPSQPGVVVLPLTPITTDDLTCFVETPSIDPEGQAVTYSFTWELDGAPSGHTGSTVSASETLGQQQWACIVSPSDGGDPGPPGQAVVEIGVPTGCWDGSVERGSGAWGRFDIVFCQTSTDEEPPAPSTAQLACGEGWTLCSAAEFTARNDVYAGGAFFGTIDDGGDCAAYESNQPASTVHATSDLVWDNYPGTCTGSIGNETTQDVGRTSRTLGSPCPLGICGAVCCYN